MSLLPGQILPPSASLGRVNDDGTVTIEQNWWLLLYNLSLQVLGNGSGLPADALIDLESVDIDAVGTDAAALRAPIAVLAQLIPTDGDPVPSLSDVRNALIQAMQPQDVVIGLDDLPDLQRALLLAQDGLLPDPAPLAQPVAVITPTGSPFTYTAPNAGSMAITGGTVSTIALIRQGTSIATGLTTALIPMSRYDQVTVTYIGAPTMTFIPWSSQ